jgi:hypothetical protein
LIPGKTESQQARRLDPEDRRAGEEQERREFPPAPPRLDPPLRRVFPVEKTHHVEERTHGAEPSAEGPAEQEGHRHEQKRQKEGGREFVSGEEGRQEYEQIGVEEELDGVGQFVPSVVVRLEEQDEEEEEKRSLGDASRDLFGIDGGLHRLS